MRAALVVPFAAALVLLGCNLAFDPDAVPRPCVGSCQGKACGADDGCGSVCTEDGAVSGCTPVCTPSCTQKYCGVDDGCGTACSQGGAVPGCTPITGMHKTSGGAISAGAGSTAADGGHSVQRGSAAARGTARLNGGHSIRQGGVAP